MVEDNMEDQDTEIQEATEQTEETEVSQDNPASLTGDPIQVDEEKEVSFPDVDNRLYNEDGTFNEDGAREYFGEQKAKDDKYEKRIQDMRKMVSTKDGFVSDKSEYFEDFAPEERFLKYFDEGTPEETKKEMTDIQEKLSDTFHSLALNKSQAYGVSNAVLEVMEKVGVLDTRTDEQKFIEKQEWIEGQKAKLGSNADNIIREAKEYIAGSSSFTPNVKVQLGNMMESMGADFIDVIHQLKDGFGSNTGGVPGSVATLQGLASDVELWDEYSNAKTSDTRRQEIIHQRSLAGRSGRLADVLSQ